LLCLLINPDRCSAWHWQDEMRQGLSYFHETIFEGLPKFLRRIDTALKNIGQPMLPLDHCLFKFGSWCV
jgi:phosphoenolpyruvate carboxylase